MISLLNVKKDVSLQLNVRHDVSCIYTCPLPMLVKCGNLMNHRTSVACISYWYGLTLPALRVRYIPDLRDRVMPRTFII